MNKTSIDSIINFLGSEQEAKKYLNAIYFDLFDFLNTEFIKKRHYLYIKEFYYNEKNNYFNNQKVLTDYKDILPKSIITNISNLTNTQYNIKHSLELGFDNNFNKDNLDLNIDEQVKNFNGNNIIFSDIINIFKKWKNYNNELINDKLKLYLDKHDKEYNIHDFWYFPFIKLQKDNWKYKLLSLVINDYDLIEESNNKFKQLIIDKFFNNGYINELVIDLNYFFWDNFDFINDFIKQTNTMVLSFRINLIPSERNKFYKQNIKMTKDDFYKINDQLKKLILENKSIFNGLEIKNGYIGYYDEYSSLDLLTKNEFYDYVHDNFFIEKNEVTSIIKDSRKIIYVK